jgi:hypothetical protein
MVNTPAVKIAHARSPLKTSFDEVRAPLLPEKTGFVMGLPAPLMCRSGGVGA